MKTNHHNDLAEPLGPSGTSVDAEIWSHSWCPKSLLLVPICSHSGFFLIVSRVFIDLFLFCSLSVPFFDLFPSVSLFVSKGIF